MSKKRLVVIEWEDSFSSDSWQRMDKAEDWANGPLLCRSVGWLISQKDGITLLASSRSGESDQNIYQCVTNLMAIPTASVRKIRSLKDPGAP